MLPTSNTLNRVSESATIKMAQLSRELAAKGVNVISLSLGEPDFNTPKHIKEAAKQAIDSGKYDSYSPISGYLDLKQAICEKLKRDNNLEYKPENIVVSTGAKQSLANVFISFLNEGDEVIIPAPFWVSYPEQVKLCNATCVIIPTTVDANFKMTPEQLEDAITPKTKFLVYSSPSNPTGSVYTRDEIEAFVKVLEKYPQIHVISDEIYEHINYVGKHVSIAEFPSMKDRTIVVNGQAKGYAMTGWRIGYIAAPAYIAKACDKLQGQVTSGTNSVAQHATIAALLGDQNPTEVFRQAFQKRRDLVLGMLNEIPNVKCNIPTGAFYVFPDLSAYFGKTYDGETIKDADDLCLFLLNVGHVASVSGSGFGAPECIRFSYAASEENLKEAFTRVKNALAKLI
ncbi:MAG TPA: pyridoxal phosphate-dependent aminotransferase [Chitinophagales bacterium]|mgnify:CR=1 FL=1|jgi:aspartate aminotransferase|nr:pyridoxal phosphate-dependent aminotransferase [Chitinophagales bacterium]HQW78176.1 pyridoxal phosphate-dependent aminotransferase [Chitinophagales bacterium]HRB66574.1 pyridoxal phosphate-dependent aminotransferase [Chitinophagales bacterium]HRB92000.1 pyridoxal phosphate-dependent aminotransferase [Chitinophagales bacterium]